MSFLGPVLKWAVLVCTTLNANELHIPFLPLDEGITCIPMAVGKQKGWESERDTVLDLIQLYMFESDYTGPSQKNCILW